MYVKDQGTFLRVDWAVPPFDILCFPYLTPKARAGGHDTNRANLMSI